MTTMKYLTTLLVILSTVLLSSAHPAFGMVGRGDGIALEADAFGRASTFIADENFRRDKSALDADVDFRRDKSAIDADGDFRRDKSALDADVDFRRDENTLDADGDFRRDN
ncbi:hypothetical protein C8R45DRAFT_1080026 [Mycena sanguinolenta]|nr:hypothetical protein C8R45DRAFT_1080026 [Mycena sanguinolenta]